MNLTRFKYIPIIGTVKNYKVEYFRKDLIAALTVAVVAIPQSMAYALIAGVNPVYGLYTAIVSTIISSIFGSSNHLIAGPTNAIALLVAGTMRNYMGLDNAYDLIFLMTFIVGLLQIAYGIMRLGKVINFVSHTVIVGFSAGAGVLIALGQLSTILGISIKNSSKMVTTEKFYYCITHLSQTNIYALGMGLMTIAIMLLCKKINKNLPGALIGIIVPIIFIVVFALDSKGVKLTGNIPSSLPPFKMIHFSLDSVQKIFSGAVAISIIGLVEALSISKTISSTSRQKIDANQEFIAQGLGNLGSSFFQCFAGSGSFTRSAINYYNGAVTRFAGIMSGGVVALVLVFFARYAKYIPSPCLAGVLILTGYGLMDKTEIRRVFKAGKFSSDSIAMSVTFLATILLPDLDYAIYTGIALSIILYLKDTNKAGVKIFVPIKGKGLQIIEQEVKSVKEKVDILVIQLEGNFYFGSASDLEEKLNELADRSKVYILKMKYVTNIDLTSIEAIKAFIRMVNETGGTMILSGVKPEHKLLLTNSNLASNVESKNIFMSEDEVFASPTNALERAREILDAEKGESTIGKVVESISTFKGISTSIS